MNRFAIVLMLGISWLAACKKETHTNHIPVVDNVIYEVEDEVVYQSNAEKDKLKTSSQYLSILYANLFQTSISQQEVTDLSEIRLAMGDKQAADELVLNGYVHNPAVVIPTDAEMRADIDAFIDNTYRRFYLRLPTPYERMYLKNMISEDPNLTPELIYTAFSTSDEYQYY